MEMITTAMTRSVPQEAVIRAPEGKPPEHHTTIEGGEPRIIRYVAAGTIVDTAKIPADILRRLKCLAKPDDPKVNLNPGRTVVYQSAQDAESAIRRVTGKGINVAATNAANAVSTAPAAEKDATPKKKTPPGGKV